MKRVMQAARHECKNFFHSRGSKSLEGKRIETLGYCATCMAPMLSSFIIGDRKNTLKLEIIKPAGV